MNVFYPKIYTIGYKEIEDIFDNEVEITEKIDGSQFSFGKDYLNNLICRSKKKQLDLDNPEKLFSKAVEYIKSIEHKLPLGWLFFAEYLKTPKHNVLVYDHVPKNNLVIFSALTYVADGLFMVRSLNSIRKWANLFDVDVVPVFDFKKITAKEQLEEYLQRESYLGGQKVEGIVVKNYMKGLVYKDRYYPVMCGKYVSEAFKEVQTSTKNKGRIKNDKWEAFKEKYRCPARWNKAVMHLEEAGELKSTLEDIGNLIKEVREDIIAEEKSIICDYLWNTYGIELLKTATNGLPEWYKKRLMAGTFC